MTLHLLPNLLDEEGDPKEAFPPSLWPVMDRLDGIISETPKVARRFFRHFSYKELLALPMESYNEHTRDGDFTDLIAPMLRGETWGFVPDAGLPCIADPGYRLVDLARKKGIKVHAHVGPSSIIQAILLSGLPSQSFAFHGYFPHKIDEAKRLLASNINLHLFIEAPYRNMQLLGKLKEILKPKDQLAVAVDLMKPTEEVFCHDIKTWKSKSVSLHKRPAIYMVHQKGMDAS